MLCDVWWMPPLTMAALLLCHCTIVAGFPVLAQVIVRGVSDVLCTLDIVSGTVYVEKKQVSNP